MVEVNVVSPVTTVVVNGDAAAISVGAGVVEVAAFTRTRYLGSSFSGNPGDVGRFVVHSESINSNAIISSGQRFLDTTEYSLSTTTDTNDTLTVLTPLYDEDVVMVWT